MPFFLIKVTLRCSLPPLLLFAITLTSVVGRVHRKQGSDRCLLLIRRMSRYMLKECMYAVRT